MFNPKFTRVFNVNEASMLINAPHEPKAEMETAQMIQHISQHKDICVIGEHLVRGAHQHICYWVEPNGVYRAVPVRIGDQVLDHWPVRQQMADLHPYLIKTEDDLKEWYRLFQEIHPFEDGNGRVGGAIIAGVSFAMWGHYLIPDGV